MEAVAAAKQKKKNELGAPMRNRARARVASAPKLARKRSARNKK